MVNGGGGGSGGKWVAYVNHMTTNDLQNYQLIPKLSVGQSILFQFAAQDIGETITIPITLFCIDNYNYMLRHMFYWNGDMVNAELDYNPNGQISFSLGGTSFSINASFAIFLINPNPRIKSLILLVSPRGGNGTK